LNYDQVKHHRRSIRLHQYDYAQAGRYFVTICTHDRLCLFGEVVEGQMKLNPFGEIAFSCWQEIPRHFGTVELDAFVVMPNHVHGIVVITVGTPHGGMPHVGTTHASPLPQSMHTTPIPKPPRGPEPRSLGAMVGSFKSAVTRRVNENSPTTNRPVWQRNYYEHVIRDEKSLQKIREYIMNNSQRWEEDKHNPANIFEMNLK